jgi:tetratricopeptide (TPR) repeat protein
MGANFGLFLIICVSGGPKNATSPRKMAVFAQTERARVQVLSASLRSATELMHQAKYEEAGECYRRGYLASKDLGLNDIAAQFLLGLGNSEVIRFRYREALESYLSVRRMFAALDDPEGIERVNSNLCSLYSQMGEFEAASDAGSRAMEHLPVRPKLLVLLANVKWRQGKVEEALRLFKEAFGRRTAWATPIFSRTHGISLERPYCCKKIDRRPSRPC